MKIGVLLKQTPDTETKIQINADKTADRLTVVQRIFRCLIRQSEALLRNIHAQYPFQSNRWAARASAVWVVWGDDLRQR